MGRIRFQGFTLIELMTVVVVISILVAVAYPSYQDHIRKAKRAEGKAALLKAAQLQERYFTENNRYADNTSAPTFQSLFGAACTYPVGSAENCADGGSYRISVVLANANATYTLTATPTAPFTDPVTGGCGNLTLTSNGARDKSGDQPKAKCW